MSPLDVLLRSPSEAARRAIDDDALAPLVATALAAIVAGAAAFGGALGTFRGGVQIAYAAMKLPLALCATLVIAVPAIYALGVAMGRRWTFRGVVALSVASIARGALVLFALAPILWLVIDQGLSYHATAVAAALMFALSGATALGVLLRGLGEGAAKLACAVAITGVFLAVSAQTSWILRPWLGRPRTDEMPFIRAREGSFADAVMRSARSAAGIYDVTREVSE